MPETAISALKPNVTQQEALRIFSSRGPSALYWALRSGPLQRIASAYVPFWLHRVSYQSNRTRVQRLFALDAVKGSLDPFEFPRPPTPEAIEIIATRNFLEPALTEAEAREQIREKVLRLLFQQGFFKLRTAELQIQRESPTFYLPYWLGFYGGRHSPRAQVRCRVMDAVRRRVEGAKASAFFEQWLAA